MMLLVHLMHRYKNVVSNNLSICNNLQGVPVSQEEQLCSVVKTEFTLHKDQMVGDNNNNNNEKLVVNNVV